MNYIKQKRAKVDYCNLCGEIKPLTWDHVPPQATLFQPDIFASNVFNDIPTENKHMKHYQSGIKYRTLCAECNNVIVGKNDDAYKDFVFDIVRALGSNEIVIKARINRALRAICGHFIAMKPIYDDKTMIEHQLREYVLDEARRFEGLNLYCWIYLYSTILNARDFTAAGHLENTHPNGIVSVMSSFPLAIVLSSADETDCLLDDLGSYSTENIDDEVEITLHPQTMMLAGTKSYKSFAWPLDVSDDETGAAFVLGNGELFEGSRLGVRKKT